MLRREGSLLYSLATQGPTNRSAGCGAVLVVVLAAVSASVRLEDEWHWLGRCYFIDVLRWQAGVCSYETGMKPIITLTWCNPTDMVHPHPPGRDKLVIKA
jgi:hypothetical protein